MLNIGNTQNSQHNPARNSRTAVPFNVTIKDPKEARIQELVYQYKSTREKKAGELLKRQYEKLVKSIAAKFVDNKHPMDDLCQLGFLKMFEKLDNFDPNRGVKFITYIRTQIIEGIKNSLREQNHREGIDRLRGETLKKKADLEVKIGREPTIEEFCQKTHIKPSTYKKRLNSSTVSIQDTDRLGRALEETFADHTDTINAVLNKVTADQLYDFITDKDAKDADKSKSYLKAYCSGLSHKDIAEIEGITERTSRRLVERGVQIIKKKVQNHNIQI